LNDVKLKIRDFKDHLRDRAFSSGDIVDKFIKFGQVHFFVEKYNMEFEMKRRIMKKFNILISDIYIVGSAKLGFSLAPKKEYQEMNEESDIDIALISEQLFNIHWKEIAKLNIKQTPRTEDEDKAYNSFIDYLACGWIRPDLFPVEYAMKNEWFDFFNTLSSSLTKRKISAGIFKDDFFFKLYNNSNIERLRKLLEVRK
jgi:predicted nucleotidyltransferase